MGRPEIRYTRATDVWIGLAEEHVAVEHMPAVPDGEPSCWLDFCLEMKNFSFRILPESHGWINAVRWLSMFCWELDSSIFLASFNDDWLDLDRPRELLHLDFLFVHLKERFRLLTK